MKPSTKQKKKPAPVVEDDDEAEDFTKAMDRVPSESPSSSRSPSPVPAPAPPKGKKRQRNEEPETDAPGKPKARPRPKPKQKPASSQQYLTVPGDDEESAGEVDRGLKAANKSRSTSVVPEKNKGKKKAASEEPQYLRPPGSAQKATVGKKPASAAVAQKRSVSKGALPAIGEDEEEGEDGADGQPKQPKKKRKIGGIGNFTWGGFGGSGGDALEGLAIPDILSPVAKGGKGDAVPARSNFKAPKGLFG